NPQQLAYTLTTPPYYSTLLLQYPSTHPNLHSFPTRRSSDLCDFVDGPHRDSQQAAHDREAREDLSTVATGSRGLRAPPGSHGREDRKSTRLNSSHGSISYAVFCLKKKNI